MPGERQADPEILQALDEVQRALRDERSALGTLPREHAELGARLEELQQERERLLPSWRDSQRRRRASSTRRTKLWAPPGSWKS